MSHPGPAAGLRAARLAYTADGVPYCEEYADVYHSAHGGIEQSRHVFLAGNGLPERWRQRRSFTILETGFGLGLNFLATWQALRADGGGGVRLHFISVEKHPFELGDLRRAHARWPELAALSHQLREAWPPLMAGFHRLHFERGRVTLTLLFGDAAAMLAQLEANVDAFFLDGFAPAKNPAMWSPAVFGEIGRLAAPEATASTWTVAAEVRAQLAQAGFSIERRPGFAAKREMLAARRQTGTTSNFTAPSDRHAIVIGAGLAGSACAERLAARGWHIDLIERGAAPAQAGSGNPSGVLLPALNVPDNAHARVARAGLLYSMRHLSALEREGLDVTWRASGVLQLAVTALQQQRLPRILDLHRFPDDFVRWVDVEEAAGLAGYPLRVPGCWHARAGWADPPSVCAANLAHHADRIAGHFGRSAARIDAKQRSWQVRDAAGSVIAEAPVVVLAAAHECTRLAQGKALPLEPVRGQISYLPPALDRQLDRVVCGHGYIAPLPRGGYCTGATFHHDDKDPEPRVADHAANLARLDAMLPGFGAGLLPEQLEGRVAFRASTPDRLPLIGPLRRWPGLFALTGLGARGLVWSMLGAELIAARLNGEPLPLERALVDAVDPVRFESGSRTHPS